jgi:hypothetical protein
VRVLIKVADYLLGFLQKTSSLAEYSDVGLLYFTCINVRFKRILCQDYFTLIYYDFRKLLARFRCQARSTTHSSNKYPSGSCNS